MLVYEVSLTQDMEVDPSCLNEGIVSVVGSITRFVHFRSWQTRPLVGDVVGVNAKDRYSLAKQKLFSWACCWWPHEEKLPYGARLEPVPLA